ncbi:hypothetical protein swp_3282 [Shewanella piezotolerans WP3]|uniref:Uncharacterized protein n=1 Tax=Shewanella piezotolerans (strain WP3 / JCM 13877) TaxID=225849 RepID=B8CRH8_SHEPW|nr:hypothetical protein swp_3282 [Shewanella piezotolerans WP3]
MNAEYFAKFSMSEKRHTSREPDMPFVGIVC